MLSLLITVVVLLLLWSRLWRTQPKGAFGVLLGLLLAWVLSQPMRPYFMGTETIPVWLPPLLPAIVALTLFVFGVLVWLRADKLPPPREPEDPHGAERHGHS